MDSIEVGGETTAYCTSCRDMRLHVIVAMDGLKPAKVECRSCQRQHKYRANAPGAKAAKNSGSDKGANAPGAVRRASRSTASSSPVVPEVNPLDALLAGRSSSAARSYSQGDSYVVGELLSHPNCGLGAVLATPSPGKISVLFRDSTRLLLHQRTQFGVVAPVLGRLEPPVRRESTVDTSSDRPPKVKSVL